MEADGEGFDVAERLAAIVEGSTDAIIGSSLQGTITSWNPGAEHIFGYRAEEIIGQPSALLIPHDTTSQLGPVLARIHGGERVEGFQAKRLHKDGHLIDLESTISPIRDATGAVVGLATVGRDMTERNRAEAERRAMELRLHQAERLQSLGLLAGGIAHDFNNLLAAIINYAGFVVEETTDNPAARADAEQIRAAAERAARLTRQLLVFSRRQPTQPERLDLNGVVTEIRDLLTRTIGTHIALQVSLDPHLPDVVADRGQVEQVLLNLALNARDAMPRGGALAIQTRPAELDQRYARAHPDAVPGQYAELLVADTGTGMSDEVARHIFEPFFTTKASDTGTGLGLATVYGAVTQAGGSITVDSTPGTGTTFRVYIPAVGAPVPAGMDAS